MGVSTSEEVQEAGPAGLQREQTPLTSLERSGVVQNRGAQREPGGRVAAFSAPPKGQVLKP